MHDSKESRRKFWAVVVTLILGFLILANSIDSGSSKTSQRFQKTQEVLLKDCETKFKAEGCIDVFIQVLSFNPETKYLDGRMFIYP